MKRATRVPALNAGRVPSVCFVFPLPLDLRSWAAGLQSVSSLFLFFFFFLPPLRPTSSSDGISQIREREGAAAVHVSNVCFCYFYFKPGPDLFPFSFSFLWDLFKYCCWRLPRATDGSRSRVKRRLCRICHFFKIFFHLFFFAARSLGAAAVAAAAARREVFTNS